MQQSKTSTEGKTATGKLKKLPLSGAWEAAAERIIEEKSKLEEADHFAGKGFRNQFFRSIARVYFDDLTDKALRNRKYFIEDVVGFLGLDRSAEKRWRDGTHPPAADKFFAVVLLLLNKSLKSIPFEKNTELLFRSVKVQIASFAKLYCGPPTCPFNRIVFRSLMHAMNCVAVDKLVPGWVPEKEKTANEEAAKAGSINKDTSPELSDTVKLIKSNALIMTVKAVNIGLRNDYEANRKKKNGFYDEVPAVDPETLATWLASWGMPYTLIAIGTKDSLWEVNDGNI